MHACDFVWKIENFSIFLKQNRDFIISPILLSNVLDETGWRIVLMSDGDSEFLTIGVRRIVVDRGPLSIDGGFNIGAVDVDGCLCRTNRVSGVFLKGTMLTRSRFVLKKDVIGEHSPLLVTDTMTLKGQVYRNSTTKCPMEKIMVRSKLGMSESHFKMTVGPNDCCEQLMSSESVKEGITFTCKWYDLERVPPFNLTLPSFTIKPQSETTSSFFLTAKVTIRQRGEDLFRTEDAHRFQAGSNISWTMSRSFDSLGDPEIFDDRSHIDLMCEVTISNGAKEDVYDTKHAHVFENYRWAVDLQPQSDFSEEMTEVALTLQFPDLRVQVDRDTFAAHRSILSARSPLFRKLFMEAETKWRDSSKLLNVFSEICLGETRPLQVQTGDDSDAAKQTKHRVTVTMTKKGTVAVFTGVGKGIMEKVLSFLYSDTVSTVDYDTAMKLLHASDMYQIHGLKRWCENYLVNQIASVHRAWQILLVAQSMHSNVLSRAARLYMYENRECFMRYISWRVFDDDEERDFLGFYSRICNLSE